MPFSSLEFVGLFLPLTLFCHYLLLWLGWRDKTYVFLLLASLIFYGVANPSYVLLLIGSVLGNYTAGLLIERLRLANRRVGWALAMGIGLNLLLLGYYKYANFFIDTVNVLAGTSHTLNRIILPLGISFYTFQQIAYLVDIARGEARPTGVGGYMAFVIFFPTLLAGPITHYSEIVPQLRERTSGRFWQSSLIIGLAIFAIGMFKKTVIADSATAYTSPVFAAASAGTPIGLIDGWMAALCYTIQLYFDFSGYSDMATGVSRIFGIKLPLNFHSPLRAPSIIDYWRRWHITLQRFIVSYMYQPCVLPLARFAAERGLNRWGSFWLTVAFPTVIIFMAVGLWHGAGWTFILFGLIHGIYLTTNEFWRNLQRKKRKQSGPPAGVELLFYHVLTLVCIVLANVLFRAENVWDAVAIWSGMLRWREVTQLYDVLPMSLTDVLNKPFLFVLVSGIIVFVFPNTQQIMGRHSPVLDWPKWRNIARPVLDLEFRLTAAWAVYIAVVLFFGLAFISRGQTEFIYFNF